jgi:hypothetical protein
MKEQDLEFITARQKGPEGCDIHQGVLGSMDMSNWPTAAILRIMIQMLNIQPENRRAA